MSYMSIIEFVSENKKNIVEEMKRDLALQFISRVNNEEFEATKELLELKIEERALARADEAIEVLLDKMKEGANNVDR